MFHSIRTLGAAGLALGAALSIALAPAASARPDPGEVAPVVSDYCALERIDTQFVLCDVLTGNGVAAPSWIPEQVTGATT